LTLVLRSERADQREADTAKKDAPQKISLYRPLEINHIRPADQRGINVIRGLALDAVEKAGDAARAQEILQDTIPDLILMDAQMPRMDGIEMIRRIRGSKTISGTPIIVMSAYGKRVIDDAINAGADGFVEKPIDLETFLETVRSKLSIA
jgi:CheY-like chemotaxis protein